MTSYSITGTHYYSEKAQLGAQRPAINGAAAPYPLPIPNAGNNGYSHAAAGPPLADVI